MMKKILTILIGSLLVGSAFAATPAEKLIKRLRKLQNKGIMIGHQDDPMYGSAWKWEEGRSDVKEVTGSYPAVMGFDLGEIELGHDKNLDGVSFNRMRKEIVAQYNRGGIVTLSWHPNNPATGKTAWDPTGDAVKSVLNGGNNQQKFEGWLKTVADFLNSLKTVKGKSIPVIFRPWHEMSGGWFWWGNKSCTPEEYKNLYALTYHELKDRYGCDNIVWAYSPNSGYDDFMKYYPGNEYVNIIGVDIYEFDKDNSKYQKDLKYDLDNLERIAKENDKIMALTETGCQKMPYDDWFTTVLWSVVENYKLSYVLFWRNAWDNPKEAYIAYPGSNVEKDFKKLYNYKRSLFLNDIK